MALNPEIRQSFLYAFEGDCIELLVNAYEIALTESRYQLDWIENDFSELLGYYVNESQLSLDKGITCKTEKKLMSESDIQVKGYADKLPRIDFVYFKIWKKQRVHFFMEAKRVKENDSGLKRAYINDGMGRYISRKYPMGCMIGYLLEGKTVETINGINSLLIKDNRQGEILNLMPNKELKSYYESNHSDIGILKHLILDFTKILN
jgi:hypothetical protein